MENNWVYNKNVVNDSDLRMLKAIGGFWLARTLKCLFLVTKMVSLLKREKK